MPKTPKFLRGVRELISSRTPEPSRPPLRTHLSDTTDDVRPTQSISATSLVPSPADPAQGDVASPLGPTADSYNNQHPSSEQATSKTKEYLSLVVNGFKLFLSKAQSCLDGTPFKAPVAAINVLIEIAEAVSDNNETMMVLMRQLSDRVKATSEAFGKASSRDAQKRIDDFNRTLVNYTAEISKLRTKAPWKKVLENEEIAKKIQDIIQQMDSSLATFQIRVILSIESDMYEVKKGLEELRTHSWHRVDSARYDVGKDRSGCTSGTRVDILNRICDWALDNSPTSPPVYWLSGMAGTGKSTIAYTIAEMFDDECGERFPKILGATFFCSRQIEDARKRINIIPTMSYQLACRIRSYTQALLKVDVVECSTTLKNQMRKLLVDPWSYSGEQRDKTLPPYLIIVDALDEMEEGGGSAFLKDLLTTLNDGNLRCLKFLITSRPDPQLVKNWVTSQGVIFHLEDVDMREMDKDIGKFLRTELPDLPDSKRKKIVERAKGLFIFAATVVRYIKPSMDTTRFEEERALDDLFQQPAGGDGSVPAMNRMMDNLYQQVLASALRHSSNLHYRLDILHIIICAREPLSVSNMVELCKCDKDTIQAVISSLHATLYISRKDGRIYWYHATFQDFFFDVKRSSNLTDPLSNKSFSVFCNQSRIHAFLAEHCFKAMKSLLRFNICKLPSSFLLDFEVWDLERRIRDNITEVLRYSLRHWGSHLTQGDHAGNELRTSLRHFLDKQLLFWIEAMNLIHSKRQCVIQLRDVGLWLQKQQNDPDGVSYLADAERFARFFCGPASESTPHLYISCLATWPHRNPLSVKWRPCFAKVPLVQTRGISNDISLTSIQLESTVNSVAFSTDGKHIVSGSDDKTVRVWDVSSGEEMKKLVGHTSLVTSVAFSTDGRHILSGSGDNTVRVWDVLSGEEVKKLVGHISWVNSVAFSTDGMQIVSGSYDNTVRVWDVLSGEQVKKLVGHKSVVKSVAFSTDGKHIVSGSLDKTVRVWDVLSGEEVKKLVGHTSWVNSVVFSTDDKHIMSGSHNNTVRVWDVSTGEEVKKLVGRPSLPEANSVAFSTDGKYIVSGLHDNTVRVWDASTGEEVKKLVGHTSVVNSVAFSTDGKHIVSGSLDKMMQVWDVSSGEDVKKLVGHTSSVNSVAFSTDGKHIMSGSEDNMVRVWNALSGEEVKKLVGHTSFVNSVAFSTDGKHIVSGSLDKTVRVWDASTGEEVKKLVGHTSSVRSVAFSTDGKHIVSGSVDKTVRVWDMSSGEEVKKLVGHILWLNSISADGKHIVSGLYDNTVRVWDVLSGEEGKKSFGHASLVSSVALSTDGKHIVSGLLDKTVRVWDVLSGEEVKNLVGCTSLVNSVAFSTDGKHIVSGSCNNLVQMWDASTGEEVKKLVGHTSFVNSVAFSTDGKHIVSGSLDNTVRVWDASTGEEVKKLVGHTSLVHSVGFPTDDKHIMSGLHVYTSTAGDLKTNPLWHVDHGWVVTQDHPHHKLMVNPFNPHVVFDPRTTNCLISADGWVSVDFAYCTLGLGWEACYTHTPIYSAI